MRSIVNRGGILFAIVLLLGLINFSEIAGIKLTKLIVPEYVYVNKPVELECQYVLQNNEKLYTVQWYKDNDEFYRFEKSGPRHVYQIDDIKVDLSQSNERKLILKNVNLKMSGVYKCEVSAETTSRSFVTAMQELKMEVIALPKEGPRIYGEQERYQIGDTINLTCTSGKSYPPTKLKWFVNDEEIQPGYENVTEVGRLRISNSGISLKASAHHFVNNHIQFRCQAIVSLGNRNVITLPVQQNNAITSKPFSKIGYKKDALISVKGSSCRTISNSVVHLALLIFYLLQFYDIT